MQRRKRIAVFASKHRFEREFIIPDDKVFSLIRKVDDLEDSEGRRFSGVLISKDYNSVDLLNIQALVKRQPELFTSSALMQFLPRGPKHYGTNATNALKALENQAKK